MPGNLRIGHTLRRMRSPLFPLSPVLLAPGLAGCSARRAGPVQAPLQVVGSAKDPATRVLNSDERMNKAIARARRELPTFQRYLAMPPSPNRSIEVKAEFFGSKTSEHMWITHPRWEARKNTFSGTLANTPYFVKSLKLGQKVTVPAHDVSDWLVEFAPVRRGARPRALGGYTIRVLSQMEADARAAKGQPTPGGAK